MADIQVATAANAARADDSGEYDAILVSFAALEQGLPADGAALPVIRATLADGTERVIVIYAIDPGQAADMASNNVKRDAVANAVQAAATAV